MPHESDIYTIRAAKVGLCCNVVLVLIKAVSLIVVNSIAIAVDLGISLVGLAVSIILFYSIKLANRPADAVHNYGYGKVENVCETLEGVVLIGISLGMSIHAIQSLFHAGNISSPMVGFFSSLVSAFINFGGAIYIIRMGEKSFSPAIRAEGLHWRLESLISAIISVSFLVSSALKLNGYQNIATYIDPSAALFVSVFIVIPSFNLAKSSFFKLLDASVEEESQMEILKQLGGHVDDYCEFKDIKTRSSGRKKFVEFTLIVPQKLTFKNGHKISTFLEDDMKKHIPNAEVTVKMEPCLEDCIFLKKGEKCPYLTEDNN